MPDVRDETLVTDLGRLWKEVLGVDTVDDQDDFFELGGHSLSALRLSSLIREELNLAVKFGHVNENPTFGALKEIARQVPVERSGV